MSDCNFSYISVESENREFYEKDMTVEKFYTKYYPHIWVPPEHVSERECFYFIERYFQEHFYYYHEQLKNFHNMYASILEAEKREDENNKNIKDILYDRDSKSTKSKFIKKSWIGKYLDIDSDIAYGFDGDPWSLGSDEKLYFRDSTFYGILSAFLSSVLKDFIIVLHKDDYNSSDELISEIENDLYKKNNKKGANYIIYGKCIDSLCNMDELEQLFMEPQYKQLNDARNIRVHELLQKQGHKPKVTICESFFMIKKLLYKLFFSKKIEKKLEEMNPDHDPDSGAFR